MSDDDEITPAQLYKIARLQAGSIISLADDCGKFRNSLLRVIIARLQDALVGSEE